jgi:uncharacterized protein (PEP-CTERM system associated)
MKPATILLCGPLLVGALLATDLFAADWQREAGVTLSAYASDNICLSDTNRQAWNAGTAAPDLLIHGQGTRANLYLKAAVRYNSLADSNPKCLSALGSSRESILPSLRYLGDLHLLENWLTLQSDAFVGTNAFNPFAAGGTDNLSGRDNLNITYQYGAGALIQRRFLERADLRMHYHYSSQHNQRLLLSDSIEHRGEFDLGTERTSSRFSMGVAGRYSEVTYEGSAGSPDFENSLASAEIRAALQLGSSWQINGLTGEEHNELISVLSDVEGSYWDAGLRWAPNPRVEVAIGTGTRFFGSTPRLRVRYLHQRTEITANYSRVLIFPRNLRTAESLFDESLNSEQDFVPDATNDPGFEQISGDPLPMSGQPTFIGNTPIVNERLAVRYRLTGIRSTFTLAAAHSEQTRLEDLGEATFTDMRALVSRSLSETLTANVRLVWSSREGEGGNVGIYGQHSQTWRVGLGLAKQLGMNTQVRVDYQHTRQESDAAFNRYIENRVTFSARYQF